MRNLPYSLDEDDLISAFAGAKVGVPVMTEPRWVCLFIYPLLFHLPVSLMKEVRLPRFDDGKMKGFGYVEFGSPEDATVGPSYKNLYPRMEMEIQLHPDKKKEI